MRIALYIISALLSFFIFILAFAPASPFWSLVQADVKKNIPDLNIYRVGGTVWDGQGELQFRQFPPSTILWHLSATRLVNQIADIQIEAQGEGHELRARLGLSETGSFLDNLTGFIHSDYINEVSTQFGFTFSGELEIKTLNLEGDNRWLTGASGEATWSGGRILLNTGPEPQVLDLPPLNGQLTFFDRQLVLDITYKQLTLLQIKLKEGGWAEISVKARLFEVANLPGPGGSDPDETVLLLEEKIL